MAGEIYEKFPEQIKPTEKYVFYSHGFIVEGTNPKPINERWGVYDFPAIKESLSDPDYNLIAYHRAAKTDPNEHAEKLVNDIRKLVSGGVNANNITIMGFSRGAFITGLASHKLADLKINTVLLAGCGRIVWEKYSDIEVNGHVLSVYETTDGAKTCKKLHEKSTEAKSFEEIAISTGKEHGAFYRPISEWIGPVKSWIKSQRN